MATENLQRRTLGEVEVQSGNGTPTHTSNTGSLYTNIDTGQLYQNVDGANGWSLLNRVSYGWAYMVQTTPSSLAQDTWVDDDVNWTLTEGENNGVYVSGSRFLHVANGRDGTYKIRLTGTVAYAGANSKNIDLGISIDGAIPESGSWNSTYLDLNHKYGSIGVTYTRYLSGSQDIGMQIRNTSNSEGAILYHVGLSAERVGE